MNITDDMLMAYADGELPAAARAQVEAALAADPELARKLAQHRQLRERLRADLADELTEPVPDHLLALLRTPATANATASNVVELRGRDKTGTHRWSLREWSAMAASLIVGAALGIAVYTNNGELMAAGDDGMVAKAELARALDRQLASAQSGDEAVQVGISFSARGGDYCRTFSVAQSALAGLACQRDGAWRIRALTDIDARATPAANYRQAGTALPAALASVVETEMSGDALDAKAEIAARARGWKH